MARSKKAAEMFSASLLVAGSISLLAYPARAQTALWPTQTGPLDQTSRSAAPIGIVGASLELNRTWGFATDAFATWTWFGTDQFNRSFLAPTTTTSGAVIMLTVDAATGAVLRNDSLGDTQPPWIILNAGTATSSWVLTSVGTTNLRWQVVAIPLDPSEPLAPVWTIPASAQGGGAAVVAANGTIYYFYDDGGSTVLRVGSDGSNVTLHIPFISLLQSAVLIPSGPVELDQVWFVCPVGSGLRMVAFTGDMTLHWKVTTSMTNPMIDAARRVVIISLWAGDPQEVIALDLDLGVQRWTQTVPEAHWQGLTSAGTSIFLYAGTYPNYASAISANGSLAWNQTFPVAEVGLAASALIDSDDRLLLCFNKRTLVLDGNSGAILANSSAVTCTGEGITAANGAFASQKFLGGNDQLSFGATLIPS